MGNKDISTTKLTTQIDLVKEKKVIFSDKNNRTKNSEPNSASQSS